MHAVSVSSQLLVSVLFITVPTNIKNSKFFRTLICVLFPVIKLCNHVQTTCSFLVCLGRIKAWLAGLYKLKIEGATPLLGHQYTPFTEAPRPAPSIPHCNTQEMPLSSYYTIKMHLNVLRAHY